MLVNLSYIVVTPLSINFYNPRDEDQMACSVCYG